jgi:hypothetical protein
MKRTSLPQALAADIFSLLFPWWVVPIALIFTKKTDTDLPRAFAWFDTPGEPDLFAKDEPAVGAIYDKYGWFIAAYNWFAIRNRAMGLQEALSRPCNEWPEDRLGTVLFGDGLWVQKKKLGPILFVRGWLVYQDKTGQPTSARPVFSFKWRPNA